jgi:trk system potassium uptake protein TrkH
MLPVAGFAVLILVGSALLWAPWSHQPGAVSYLDALFTSTSAVCVTGLVTVSTASAYTVAGQVVILLLIQIGGLGVMTYAAMTLSLLRRRLSLRAQAALHESLFQKDEVRDFRRRLRQIVIITFGIEAVGALVLFFSLLPHAPGARAAWSSVFHSISAFCNAGFSILPGNLADLRDNHLFTAVIMVLIVAGGLGFTVLHELFGEARRMTERRPPDRPRRLSLHANLVLRTSLLLIVGGAALLLLFGVTDQADGWGAKVEAAFFHSISARTAGFNTIDVGALPLASLLVLVMLMFVGGSPGSCAGGVKTSSLAVLFARVRSYLTGEEEARLLGRRVSRDLVRSAGLLFVLAFGWNLVGLLLLAYLESGRAGIGLHNLLFEQVSAFGTVGLSTADTTAGLSVAGKLWIIATMYVGRLGPLTLASLAVYRRASRVTFPEGKVMIG